MIILRLKNEAIMGLSSHNRVLSKLYNLNSPHFLYFIGKGTPVPDKIHQRIKGKAVLDSLRVKNRRECEYVISGDYVDFLVGEE